MSHSYLLLLDSADAAPQKPLYYKSQSFTKKDMKKMYKDCAKVGVYNGLAALGRKPRSR